MRLFPCDSLHSHNRATKSSAHLHHIALPATASLDSLTALSSLADGLPELARGLAESRAMAGGVRRLGVAAMVALLVVAVVQIYGAEAQGTQCSATQPCAVATYCCSQYGFCDFTPAHCGPGCQNGPCASGWSSFFSEADFDARFPNRASIYTYASFQAAAASYPAFANGAGDVGKREMAAFLANTDHESGGFVFVREQNPPNDYCEPNDQFPCAPNQQYYGRGPIQISFNYNYGECGADVGKDLLGNPDQVATDGGTAFQTALWFWMTRNCHEAITNNPPSFAQTIRIINGGVECDGRRPDLVQSRIDKYLAFCSGFGISPGSDLNCGSGLASHALQF